MMENFDIDSGVNRNTGYFLSEVNIS